MILIAIALLGGMTAMFTRSGDETEDTGEYEKREITAASIMRYAKSVELGVQELLNRECSESTLSFWDDSNADGDEDGDDDYYNDDAPGNHSCHVFDGNGAGLVYNDGGWIFTGHTRILGLGTDTRSELLVAFPVDKKTCMQINDMIGVANISEDAPVEEFDTTAFTGTYGNGTAAGVTIGDAVAALEKTQQSCLKNGSDYHFVKVLIER